MKYCHIRAFRYDVDIVNDSYIISTATLSEISVEEGKEFVKINYAAPHNAMLDTAQRMF